MRLCVPVSDGFRRNQDALLPLVGAVSFKTPSDEAYPGKVLFLECSISIADPNFAARLESAGLLAALKSGRFASFACDIGPACAQVEVAASPNGYPRYLPLSEPLDEATYLAQGERNVEFLRRHFSGVVKVENLNYFPTGAYELVCEPAFIARTVRDLGIELLLDTAHAVVSAENLGVPVEAYLAGLPLERVTEIQLSGPRRIKGIWEDAHDVPTASDYLIAEHVARQAAVEWITVEYYKDDRLVDEYLRLADGSLAVTTRQSRNEISGGVR